MRPKEFDVARRRNWSGDSHSPDLTDCALRCSNHLTRHVHAGARLHVPALFNRSRHRGGSDKRKSMDRIARPDSRLLANSATISRGSSQLCELFAEEYVIPVRSTPAAYAKLYRRNYRLLRPAADRSSFEVAKLSRSNKNFGGSGLISLRGFPKSRRM